MRVCAVILALTGLLAVVRPTGAETPAVKLSAAALAAKIDEHIGVRWKEKGATPAPLADDAEFVRRLHLDLTGRVPDILAARDFIDNPARDKRDKLVARLLADDRYPIHWANVWRQWVIGDTTELQNPYLQTTFANAMREHLRKNTSYDAIVRDVLTGNAGVATSAAYAFYQGNQFKAENLASATSRVFLGVKLECAQCHNHPFARWKRQQFWEFAAFYAGITPAVRQFSRAGTPPAGVGPGTGEITIPGTDKKVKARFLDGAAPKWKGDTRTTLAEWLVAKENPFFARAAVNRVWEYLLGTGLVEPVDEESVENPASHPALLDLLAQQFAANDYDLKYLIGAIVRSGAYQRTTRQTHSSQADARLFARMRVRGLSPEQLFDSLTVATGHRDDDAGAYGGVGRVYNPNSPRAEFLRRFPNQDKRAEQQTSILQALYLMNGKIVADATSLEHNRNLAIIAEATSVRTSRRVEQVFLITLARKPTPAESARLVRYVDGGGPNKDSARALCDVFWALLNSSEFCVNH